MNFSLFKKPDPGSLRLWILVCLLPTLAFTVLTSDIWFAPRSVLTGTVTSKSFRAESPGYGAMHFALSGRPYDFSAGMKIVRIPDPRPASNYDALRNGSTVSVTVFTRDIAELPNGTSVPVLRIDASGEAIFLAGRLWQSGVAGTILVVATLVALLGMTVRADVFAGSRVGRFVLMLDRPVKRFADAISPVREFDTIDRQVQHERALAMGRWGGFIIVFVLAMAVYLLVSIVI